MKVTVLNGSPKGDQSVTMQYILYIQKKFPMHEFKILNVAQQINRLENNEEKLREVIEEINTSDAIIWGTPVYVMLVPSQLKQFIELIWKKYFTNIFENKYAAIFLTSIHFYDHISLNYLRAICDDLNMKYIGHFAADTFDLLIRNKRKQLLLFAENFFDSIANQIPTIKQYDKLRFREFEYQPAMNENKISVNSKKVLILTDSADESSNLFKMVQRFKNSFVEDIELININDVDVKGGCIACLKCGYDHQCAYDGKDGFRSFWENKMTKADIIIMAGQIIDRYISSRWKMIFDRAFYNNHTPTLIGKQVGFIISGPLAQIPNISEIFQAFIEFQGSNFVGFVSDEFGDSKEIDSLIFNLAIQLVKFSKSNYIKPATFLGAAGTKIFRDDVFGRNRFIFQADHKYYEEHGLYDTFPQNDKRAIEMNKKLIPLMQIEKIRKKMDFKEELLKPFKKVLEDSNK